MTKVQKLMNDSAVARWTVLVLIALMMFFGYMFVDVMSPLQSLIEQQRGWDPDTFGTYASSEYILNVCGFLILAGIILDKMGVRFTGILSASMMFIGASIKYVGITDWFQTTAFCGWLDSWWVALPGSAKMACLGFMIFGCGCEMAGTTVSKAIAKWFKGKEMAMAMGIEMAIARVGVFSVFSISPILASKLGGVQGPVGFCTVLLLIGLINYYITSGEDTDRLFSLLDDAKKNEPGNASLYYVEGNIYLQLGNAEKAKEAYRKCSEINPEYEWGYIGEGMMYYDQAIEIQDKAQSELDDAKYMELVKEFEVVLKNCLAPFEKAFEITKDESIKMTVAEYLKNANYRFSSQDPSYKEAYDKYNAYLNQ